MITFVTGTDTGVGKTIVTAALTLRAQSEGHNVYVVKPAQTGVTADEPGDLDEVRRLVGGVDGHEGVRLPSPLAPVTAARVDGVLLPGLDHTAASILAATLDYDLVLVEGSGGVRVSLADDFDLIDLADRVSQEHPVEFVVVARAGLGSINHTLLTVDAIRARGLAVRGIVVGSYPEDPGLAEVSNLDDLPTLSGAPLLGVLPEGCGSLGTDDFHALVTTRING